MKSFGAVMLLPPQAGRVIPCAVLMPSSPAVCTQGECLPASLSVWEVKLYWLKLVLNSTIFRRKYLKISTYLRKTCVYTEPC